ncbi:MAG: tRNA lysidine(34) synthetase TilS [Actinomycetota bacterium]
MVEPGRVTDSLGGPGFELVERAASAIDRYGMLTSGPVVVAVSGGPDSVCLLDVLARLSSRYSIQPVVAHVDHALSEESDRIAARVGHLAAEAGYDAHVARATGLEGPNLQARARAFRYEFFGIVATKVSANRIATGHTLDDRVETTLARLVHGAGTRGLAGLPPIDNDRIRPLIAIRRSETRSYCDERGLEYWVDPANDDPRFERARVRHELVAAIQRGWGDGAVEAIARSAESLRDDAQLLETLATSVYGELAREGKNEVTLSIERLGDLPRALKRRVLERAVGEIRDRSGGIDAAVDALDVKPIKTGARFAVASGIEIVIGRDVVTVSRMPE